MYEYNPWADLLPDFSADLVDAPALALPQIAGASPGLIDEVGGFIGGAIENELRPLLDGIGGLLNDLLKNIWAAVQAAISLVMRLTLRRMLDTFGWLLSTYNVIVFRQRLASPSVTAGDMFSMLFQVLWEALINAVNGIANWIRDRVQEISGAAAHGFNTVIDGVGALVGNAANFVAGNVRAGAGFAARGFGDLASAVYSRIDSATTWVASFVVGALGFAARGFGDLASAVYSRIDSATTWVLQTVVNALGYAARGFKNLADFVISQVTGLGKWVYDNIGRPVLDELKKVPGYILQGAQDIAGFFEEAFRRVFLGPTDILVGLVEGKLAIPGKLLHGEYATLEDLIVDIVDPPPVIIAALVGALVIPLFIAIVTSGIMTTLVAPLLEYPTQEARARIGAHLLTTTEVHEAWDRGLIGDEDARDQLRRQGYGGGALHALEELRHKIPGAADLMRMADKRVWSLQVPEKYGQYSELPEQVVGYMTQIGFPEEWTRNYWRAHWDLPSPQQVFEMLHRGFISEDDITQYLGLTDWLPFFRDKLLSISYNPLTRVDIRRIYKLGVIDEAQVKRAYQDIGYNEHNADLLTQFTVRYYGSAQKTRLDEITDLSSSTIRLAYRRHVIDREAAIGFLVDQGEGEDVADFLLSLDDAQLAVNPLSDAGVPIKDESVSIIRQAYREGLYAYDEAVTHLEAIGVLGAEADVMLALDDIAAARDLKKAQTDLVRERYTGYYVDAGVARAQLSAVGVPDRQQALLLAEWDVERQKGTRRLTVPEIFTALTKKFITRDDAYGRLLVLGYTDDDANIIFDLRGVA